MTAAKTARQTRRYRGQTTEELRAQRRERLLRAGLKLIGREGYSNTSIERVCTTARVSTRHFYEHFDSREALLAALFDAFIDDAVTVVTANLATVDQTDMMKTILSAIGAFARFCMENPERSRLALVETVGVSPVMEQRRRGAIRQFADLVSQLAAGMADSGLLPPGDYRLSGIALVGATHELLVEWLSGESGFSSEQMERQITGIFRAIILGSQRGRRFE